MLHIALHLAVPVLVGLAFYRSYWRYAVTILVATMLVDLDHLLATPIYDPGRCSINAHPLHTAPAIAMYVALFVLAYILGRRASTQTTRVRTLHLIGLGLLIHMALDWFDCLI